MTANSGHSGTQFGTQSFSAPNNTDFFKSLWRSVKEQIVQDAPPEIEFCEFQFTRKQCTLELTGTCDIRPQPALVFIRPALAGLRPQWASGASAGVSGKPAQVA
jgi:hypothetical protein